MRKYPPIGFIVRRKVDGALMISRKGNNAAFVPVRSWEAPTLCENEDAANFLIRITLQEFNYEQDAFQVVPIRQPRVGITVGSEPIGKNRRQAHRLGTAPNKLVGRRQRAAQVS